MLEKRGLNADAGVPYDEVIRSVARRGLLRLLHSQAESTARLIEFDPVRKQVQEYLRQTHFVGHDAFVDDVDGIDEEIELFGRHRRMHDRTHVVQQIRQLHRFLVNLDLTAFNAAHIEYVVDEGQEVFA